MCGARARIDGHLIRSSVSAINQQQSYLVREVCQSLGVLATSSFVFARGVSLVGVFEHHGY
jgi:hypothetical protein